jgi:hypothetical protein
MSTTTPLTPLAFGDEREHRALPLGEPRHPLVAGPAGQQLSHDLGVEHRGAGRDALDGGEEVADVGDAPPTFTDEGIRAALALRAADPAIPVLVLSQYVEERAGRRRPRGRRPPARARALRAAGRSLRRSGCARDAHLQGGRAAGRAVQAGGAAGGEDAVGDAVQSVAALPDASDLDTAVARTAPELCILDVRLPPTFTDEGSMEARKSRMSATRSFSR